MKVHELIAKPENWCQGVFAQYANGEQCDLFSDQACRWCLSGAIRRCYSNYFDILNLVGEHLRYIDSYYGIISFNDNSSHAEVLALCKKLDI